MCITPSMRAQLELDAAGTLICAGAGFVGTDLLTNLPPHIGAVYGGVFGISFSLITASIAYCFPEMDKTIQFVLTFFASVGVSSYLTTAITGVSITWGIGLMLSIATIIPLAALVLCCCPEKLPRRA